MSKKWSSFEKDKLLMESWRSYIAEEPQKVEEAFFGKKEVKQDYPATEVATLVQALSTAWTALKKPGAPPSEKFYDELEALITSQNFMIQEQEEGRLFLGQDLKFDAIKAPTITTLLQTAKANKKISSQLQNIFKNAGFSGMESWTVTPVQVPADITEPTTMTGGITPAKPEPVAKPTTTTDVQGETAAPDNVYDLAVAHAVRTNDASIDSIQKEFNVAEDVAKQILNQMEKEGLVSKEGKLLVGQDDEDRTEITPRRATPTDDDEKTEIIPREEVPGEVQQRGKTKEKVKDMFGNFLDVLGLASFFGPYGQTIGAAAAGVSLWNNLTYDKPHYTWAVVDVAALAVAIIPVAAGGPKGAKVAAKISRFVNPKHIKRAKAMKGTAEGAKVIKAGASFSSLINEIGDEGAKAVGWALTTRDDEGNFYVDKVLKKIQPEEEEATRGKITELKRHIKEIQRDYLEQAEKSLEGRGEAAEKAREEEAQARRDPEFFQRGGYGKSSRQRRLDRQARWRQEEALLRESEIERWQKLAGIKERVL